MHIKTLIEIVAVLVVLMLAGYIGAKRGIFTPQVTKAMSALVFNLFLVSSSFSSICKDVPEMTGAKLVHILLVLSIAIILPYIMGGISSRIFFSGTPYRATAELCMSVVNTLMFGLPIVQQVYGGSSVMFMGLSSVPFNLMLYSVGVWRLLKSSGSEARVKIRLKDILSPVLIFTLVALVVLVAKLPVPSLVMKFVDSTASATLPMSMLVIGATIGSGNLLESIKDKRVYVVSFIRLIVAPALAWLLLSPICADPLLLKTAVVIAGCPCGVVVSVLAVQYEQDTLLASRSVMMSTLLSVITLPIIIILLG